MCCQVQCSFMWVFFFFQEYKVDHERKSLEIVHWCIDLNFIAMSYSVKVGRILPPVAQEAQKFRGASHLDVTEIWLSAHWLLDILGIEIFCLDIFQYVDISAACSLSLISLPEWHCSGLNTCHTESVIYYCQIIHCGRKILASAFHFRPRILPWFEGHRIIHELAGHLVLFTSLQMACT